MEYIWDVLYKLLVKSRIVWYLMPLVRRYVIRNTHRRTNSNHFILDHGGSTIGTTKLNNKVYPPFGEQNFSKIKHIKIRDDDVLICGYPKTGCHWAFEIVRMLLKKTTSVSSYGKEFEGFIEILPEFVLDSLPSPRVLCTHIPYEDLPEDIKAKKTKIILTARNPKDTVVSYYNHIKNLKHYQYDGTFHNFFELFMKGEMVYGSFYKHAADWHKVMTSTSTPNPIFLIKFEKLKGDPVEMIKQLARFLEVTVSDEFANNVAQCTDFKKMKSAVEKYNVLSVLYRKGIVGDWKNWLTEDQNAEMDAMTEFYCMD